jgi:hypothetical protein
MIDATQRRKDWAAEAQRAAETRLALCAEWRDHYENDGDEPTEPDPSCAPYCGCDTCVVREILDAAWPIFLEGVRSGDLSV